MYEDKQNTNKTYFTGSSRTLKSRILSYLPRTKILNQYIIYKTTYNLTHSFFFYQLKYASATWEAHIY